MSGSLRVADRRVLRKGDLALNSRRGASPGRDPASSPPDALAATARRPGASPEEARPRSGSPQGASRLVSGFPPPLNRCVRWGQQCARTCPRVNGLPASGHRRDVCARRPSRAHGAQCRPRTSSGTAGSRDAGGPQGPHPRCPPPPHGRARGAARPLRTARRSPGGGRRRLGARPPGRA